MIYALMLTSRLSQRSEEPSRGAVFPSSPIICITQERPSHPMYSPGKGRDGMGIDQGQDPRGSS